MKKIILSAITLTTALCAFAGCGGGSPTYDTLNTLVGSVSSYELNVTTTTNGDTLESNYAVVETDGIYEITYTYEVLNEIDLSNPTTERKSVKTGVALVENGSVISYTGDAINVIPRELTLNFAADNFTSVEDGTGEFSAEVSNVAAFLGTAQQISDMAVTVEYTETALGQVAITCSTANSEVAITYSFN